MPYFSVITDLCHQDGICAQVCPTHVIKWVDGQTPVMRHDSENSCIACGHCMAFCPHGAARIDVLPVEDMRHIVRKSLPDAQGVETLMAARRSIRRFKETPIPRDLLVRVLSTDRYAPSAKNARQGRWLVLYEPESMRAVGDLTADWLDILAADPATAHIIAEAKPLAKSWRMGNDPLFRGAPHLVFAVIPVNSHWANIDAAIALTYLELACVPHSIGACWAGYVSTAVRMHKPLRDFLGLAENETVGGGQMLGFSAIRPTASAPRHALPVEWR